MADSPPQRIPNHHSLSSPIPLRSALKHGDSFRSSRPSPPTSPPLPTLPGPASGHLSLSPSSASPSPLMSAGGYTPKVSFDTFENPAASMFSFTLCAESVGYARTPQTRVFLCAASPDESGCQALDWALDSLVQDGDELVVFRGFDEDILAKDHDAIREEARELLQQVQAKSVEYDPDRKMSVRIEFIAGKVSDNIDRLIALYRPESVVVGTRGQRGMIQSWGAALGAPGMGSISKYCLSRSPVPIIVVRPERKVRKAQAKRKADPKRGKHFDELTKTKSLPVGTLPR